jgi:large subunit ribosomal protein L33
MAKAKNLIRLISSGGTGIFLVKKKNPKGLKAQTKISLRKFDKKLRKHVVFNEAKIK